MTKGEEITAIKIQAVEEGRFPREVADLAIEHYEKHLSQHYDIYPKDTPLTMKKDPHV
jgi:hypothetical protein